MRKTIKEVVREWLGITEPEAPEAPRDWSAEFARLEKEHWKFKQMLKQRSGVDCPVCHKKVWLWPMETESYYTKGGEAYHVDCYTKVTEVRPDTGSVAKIKPRRAGTGKPA